MDNSATLDSAVMALLADLKTKKGEIEQRFQSELAEVDRQIEAVSTTARLLRQPPAQRSTIPLTIPTILKAKTVKEACIEIARANGGVVRVVEAKESAIAAGILKKTKNSWGVVNTTLVRSKEFEKDTAPGQYRLKDDQQVRLAAVS